MLRLSGQCRALSTVQLIYVIVNCFAQMRPIIPCPDIMEHVLDHSIRAIRGRGHVNDLPPSGLLMTSKTPELCKNLNYRTMCSQFHEKVALDNGRTSSTQNRCTHRAACCLEETIDSGSIIPKDRCGQANCLELAGNRSYRQSCFI